ncbi:DUF3466 family protein [Ideonella sp. DXS29W]|uniref:DUF3466 family protein n=1 Tax=Ideonella lacteola TaxID=2984193 RepID=A0ABU9BXA5_9BURK
MLHAMLFNGTQTIDLGIVDTSGGIGCTLGSSASALNDKGQVAGACTVGDGEHYVAFLWQSGVLKTLGTLGGAASGAAAINRKGHVVGDSERSDSFTHAYVYRNGRMRDLGVLEGDLNSTATGINDAGLIVGNSFGAGGSHAFIHQDGVNTRLPMISGAQSSSASDINNLGWVVGQAYGPKTNHGWVYDGNAVYDLNLLLTNADPRYTVKAARRIADNGHIAADVVDGQSGRTVGATLVPVK